MNIPFGPNLAGKQLCWIITSVNGSATLVTANGRAMSATRLIIGFARFRWTGYLIEN
jgi:hypothetical protein